jgi:hypothetical protein
MQRIELRNIAGADISQFDPLFVWPARRSTSATMIMVSESASTHIPKSEDLKRRPSTNKPLLLGYLLSNISGSSVNYRTRAACLIIVVIASSCTSSRLLDGETTYAIFYPLHRALLADAKIRLGDKEFVAKKGRTLTDIMLQADSSLIQNIYQETCIVSYDCDVQMHLIDNTSRRLKSGEWRIVMKGEAESYLEIIENIHDRLPLSKQIRYRFSDVVLMYLLDGPDINTVSAIVTIAGLTLGLFWIYFRSLLQ